MKKVTVRRLGVASVARFVGVANAVIGFVIGIFVAFGGLVGVLENDSFDTVTKIVSSLGVVLVSLILVPLLAFLYGWLYGAIVSLVANLFLNTSSGIELDIEEETKR